MPRFPSHTQQQHCLQFTPIDNQRLINLCGQCDQNLHQIEEELNISIYSRGHQFYLVGEEQAVALGTEILNNLYSETQRNSHLSSTLVHQFIRAAQANLSTESLTHKELILHTRACGTLRPLNASQRHYLSNISKFDINFGIGPAGTGKTYLAIACAVSALDQDEVSRIVLVRPAVEAGEKLGFLPGDFSQKLDPYFRPLYDALYEILGFNRVNQLLSNRAIEVAPLAYMRGRTLSDAYIILDEAQNTTKEQMKMFLTRIGFNSKSIITGDVTQTDLPKGCESGLNHCLTILKQVKGIGFTYFCPQDIVRHGLVQTILKAYENHETHPST